MNPLNVRLFGGRKKEKAGPVDVAEDKAQDVVIPVHSIDQQPLKDKPKDTKTFKDKKGKPKDGEPGMYARIFSDRDSKAYNLLPCIVLALYSIIGGAIFYAIENNICHGTRVSAIEELLGTTNEAAVFQALRNDSCISTFWEALYFAGTVYTTIGYGTVVTCCGTSRAATVVYAVFGIPLTFLTLERMGRWMAAVVNGLYLEVAPFFKRVKTAVKKGFRSCCSRGRTAAAEKVLRAQLEKLEDMEFTTKKREFRHHKQALPIWLAFVLIFGFIFLMGSVLAMKEGWSLANGLYFTMVTITTIGFGDMHQTRFEFTFVYQLLMIFGLALFSMLVNLVQRHIEIVTDTFAYKMRERYKERLLASEGAGEAGPPVARDSNKEFLRLAKESDPSYYRFLMGRDTKDRLAQELEAQIRMKNSRVQTDSANQRTQSTMTREEDLYRGGIIFARRQALHPTTAKARAGSEPPSTARKPLPGVTPTTVRVDSPVSDASATAKPPAPKPRSATFSRKSAEKATKLRSAKSAEVDKEPQKIAKPWR